MTMEASARPRIGRPPEEETTARVVKLHKAGKTYLEIASALGFASDSTVRHHLERAGIAAKEYEETNPVKNGKRECRQCHESKKLSAYPSVRSGVCQKCTRLNRKAAKAKV